MAWIADYQETLRELGIEENDLQFPGGIDNGTYLLTEKYISRLESTLITWFTNILEVSFSFCTSEKIHWQTRSPKIT